MRRIRIVGVAALVACGSPKDTPKDSSVDEHDAEVAIDAGVDGAIVIDPDAAPELDAMPIDMTRVRVGGTCYRICTVDTDPDNDGWGYEMNASCVMQGNTLATTEPFCDTPLPQTPYEATPAANVSATTTSVATLPRPTKITLPAPTNCPHEDASLVAWNPAWLDSSGMIHVPANTRTLLRGNTDVPATTLIQHFMIPTTSTVVFADQPTTLRVRDLHVEGKLKLGSPTCRLQSAITIELDTNENVADSVTRTAIHTRAGLGLMVHKGATLDVFGKLYQPTWTRLGATANAAATQITLAEAVDWEVGQKIVIVTSDRRDYPFTDENEVRTITSVTNSGLTLGLDTALTHLHYGGTEYQVEVALLSRNIVFRTAPGVLATNATFGGHIMSHADDTRISGAELYGLGQQNFVGRYPFHMHIAGDVNGRAQFTDNSIWRSNWRCAVLHRTDRALVSKNVAYDVWGHCYYLEDGVEMNNEVSYNLAARVKILGAIDQTSMDAIRAGGQEGFTLTETAAISQPADRAAAGFYIPNGNNKIIGNAASGGFAGFSLPNFPVALNGSPERIAPIRYSASHFDGNSAHSSAYFWGDGGCVYAGGILRVVNTKLEYTSGRSTAWELLRHTPDVFNNTKTFLCENGIVHWGNSPRAVNLEAWDNGLLAKLFGSASIHGAVSAARTGNSQYLTVRPVRW